MQKVLVTFGLIGACIATMPSAFAVEGVPPQSAPLGVHRSPPQKPVTLPSKACKCRGNDRDGPLKGLCVIACRCPGNCDKN